MLHISTIKHHVYTHTARSRTVGAFEHARALVGARAAASLHARARVAPAGCARSHAFSIEPPRLIPVLIWLPLPPVFYVLWFLAVSGARGGLLPALLLS